MESKEEKPLPQTKASTKRESDETHLKEEVKRLIKYYNVVISNQFYKMHFFLNFKLNNSSSYVEICIDLINKFFSLKKIVFVQLENEFSRALIRDFKENTPHKLR